MYFQTTNWHGALCGLDRGSVGNGPQTRVYSKMAQVYSPVTGLRRVNISGSACLHVPAGYAGISRWHHNMPAVVCRAGFLLVCHAFSPTWCHFQNSSVVPGTLLRGEIITCIRQDRQAKMHSDPDHDNFLLITRYCFTLCKEFISPNSYSCNYNKKYR